MTQKEAIVRALEHFGGRARLADIYRQAPRYADFSRGKTPENSIRSCLLRESMTFRRYKPGWWELVSFQEEMAQREGRIRELEEEVAQRERRIRELEEEVARLRAVKTEDDFVARFVEKVKHHLKRDKKTVEEIRKLMDALGRPDADRELDEWMEETHTPVLSIEKAGDVITAGGKKVVHNRLGRQGE